MRAGRGKGGERGGAIASEGARRRRPPASASACPTGGGGGRSRGLALRFGAFWGLGPLLVAELPLLGYWYRG